jgi:hypothetical protein
MDDEISLFMTIYEVLLFLITPNTSNLKDYWVDKGDKMTIIIIMHNTQMLSSIQEYDVTLSF